MSTDCTGQVWYGYTHVSTQYKEITFIWTTIYRLAIFTEKTLEWQGKLPSKICAVPEASRTLKHSKTSSSFPPCFRKYMIGYFDQKSPTII